MITNTQHSPEIIPLSIAGKQARSGHEVEIRCGGCAPDSWRSRTDRCRDKCVCGRLRLGTTMAKACDRETYNCKRLAVDGSFSAGGGEVELHS